MITFKKNLWRNVFISFTWKRMPVHFPCRHCRNNTRKIHWPCPVGVSLRTLARKPHEKYFCWAASWERRYHRWAGFMGPLKVRPVLLLPPHGATADGKTHPGGNPIELEHISCIVGRRGSRARPLRTQPKSLATTQWAEIPCIFFLIPCV